MSCGASLFLPQGEDEMVRDPKFAIVLKQKVDIINKSHFSIWVSTQLNFMALFPDVQRSSSNLLSRDIRSKNACYILEALMQNLPRAATLALSISR